MTGVQTCALPISHEEKLRHKRPAFGHRLYVKGEVSQPFNVVLYPMILQVFNTIGYNVVDVLHGKALIQLPLNPEFMGNSEPDLLHVDMNQKHVVFLYYVDDSDGDTIIVDKKYEGYNLSEKELNYKNYNVLKKVTPKKGRVVIFDGSYYHTAEQPKNNVRIILNYNVIIEKQK